jgi:hypothetical protein
MACLLPTMALAGGGGRNGRGTLPVVAVNGCNAMGMLPRRWDTFDRLLFWMYLTLNVDVARIKAAGLLWVPREHTLSLTPPHLFMQNPATPVASMQPLWRGSVGVVGSTGFPLRHTSHSQCCFEAVSGTVFACLDTHTRIYMGEGIACMSCKAPHGTCTQRGVF